MVKICAWLFVVCIKKLLCFQLQDDSLIFIQDGSQKIAQNSDVLHDVGQVALFIHTLESLLKI